MQHVFFTVNDFSKEGGNTIRMYGIVNELASLGHTVYLVSNTVNFEQFHSKIKHIPINYKINIKAKRKIQILAGLFPSIIARTVYRDLLIRIAKVLNENELSTSRIYSFEYLDNTLAYLLFKNYTIAQYCNDLHGVVPLEFRYKAKYAKDILSKFKYMFKYYTSVRLDNKVFCNAWGFIYASEAMRDYYMSIYNFAQKKKAYVVPYVLGSSKALFHVDQELIKRLKSEFDFTKDEIVIAFAGSFKRLGGVPDLVTVFAGLTLHYPEIRLLLIGDGETLAECLTIVQKANIEEKVIFVGRIQYRNLQSYFSMADIIVCPDRMNPYSDIIVHVKYYDALLSGKIVICGFFRSIRELDNDQSLSIHYDPSSIESMKKAIRYAIDNRITLLKKYEKNVNYVLDNFSYGRYVHVFEKNLSNPHNSLGISIPFRSINILHKTLL